MKPDAVRRSLKFLCLLGFAFVSACAGDGKPASDGALQTRQEPQPLSQPILANRTPAPSTEPEIQAPAPAAVIGWMRDDLSRTFGNATLVRHDLGAEIWQYRTDACVLFLFLYPKDGNLQVSHLDVRGTTDAGACLKAVIKARNGHITG